VLVQAALIRSTESHVAGGRRIRSKLMGATHFLGALVFLITYHYS